MNLDPEAFKAACKALAISDLTGRGPDSIPREEAERIAERSFDEWSDDAEACVRAYLQGLTPTLLSMTMW